MSETDCLGNCKTCGRYLGSYTVPMCPNCDAGTTTVSSGDPIEIPAPPPPKIVTMGSACPVGCEGLVPPPWALALARAVREEKYRFRYCFGDIKQRHPAHCRACGHKPVCIVYSAIPPAAREEIEGEVG